MYYLRMRIRRVLLVVDHTWPSPPRAHSCRGICGMCSKCQCFQVRTEPYLCTTIYIQDFLAQKKDEGLGECDWGICVFSWANRNRLPKTNVYAFHVHSEEWRPHHVWKSRLGIIRCNFHDVSFQNKNYIYFSTGGFESYFEFELISYVSWLK